MPTVSPHRPTHEVGSESVWIWLTSPFARYVSEVVANRMLASVGYGGEMPNLSGVRID